MKKATLVILTLILALGFTPLKAQGFNFKLVLFNPQMNSDLWETNMENLALTKQDMRELGYAFEYEHFFRNRVAVTFEILHYEKEHFSQYRDYEYDDGSPIYQNLALSLTAFDLNVKFYPFGHRARFSPFFGGGAGLYRWVYEQWGEFINFEDFTVSEGYADTRTYTLGFNARAGALLRVTRSVAFSLEARYQFLKGELSSLFEGFEKLDLNALSLNIGLNYTF